MYDRVYPPPSIPRGPIRQIPRHNRPKRNMSTTIQHHHQYKKPVISTGHVTHPYDMRIQPNSKLPELERDESTDSKAISNSPSIASDDDDVTLETTNSRCEDEKKTQSTKLTLNIQQDIGSKFADLLNLTMRYFPAKELCNEVIVYLIIYLFYCLYWVNCCVG